MVGPFTLFIIPFLIICPAHSMSPAKHKDEAPWCYDVEDPFCGPLSWRGLCGLGTLQSPLNFHLHQEKKKHTLTKIRLDVDELESSAFFMMNNGNGLNVKLIPCGENSSFFPGTKTGLHSTPYTLSSVDFHWGENDTIGSEHRLDGQSFSMEMHLIHYKEEFRSFKDAIYSGEPDAIAVISILLQVDPDEKPSPALAPLIENLDLVKKADPKKWVKVDTELDLDELLPLDSPTLKVIHYTGSLTYPPCSEEVEWFLFSDPVPIAPSDAAAFRKLHNEEGKNILNNHRPVQPTGDRGRRHFELLVIEGVHVHKEDKDDTPPPRILPRPRKHHPRNPNPKYPWVAKLRDAGEAMADYFHNLGRKDVCPEKS